MHHTSAEHPSYTHWLISRNISLLILRFGFLKSKQLFQQINNFSLGSCFSTSAAVRESIKRNPVDPRAKSSSFVSFDRPSVRFSSCFRIQPGCGSSSIGSNLKVHHSHKLSLHQLLCSFHFNFRYLSITFTQSYTPKIDLTRMAVGSCFFQRKFSFTE